MLVIKDQIKIRQATADDADTLCKWWNDGSVMAHAGFPNGLGTTAEKIAKSLETDNEQNRRLIIELDNIPIGEMSYRTPIDKTAEIGIKICEFQEQNKGLGSQCLKMLMDYLFQTMEYDKIILDTNLKNKRAQHVYEKLGFRKVRTRIDCWKDQLGVLQSAVDYEILREEFLNST